ncbi:MAG: hypothetical protein U0R18_13845 [Mycobacterium sp.]
MAEPRAATDVAQELFRLCRTESVAALRSWVEPDSGEFTAVICELAALDGSLGWLAALSGVSVRGSGSVRDGRLSGQWEWVVGARSAELLRLSLPDGVEAVVPAAAARIEPADGLAALDGARVCAVTVDDVPVADVRPVDPRTVAGAAAAVVGSADGVWRSHVDRVRARLTVSHGGDEVTDDAAAQVARAASDIDAARLQVVTALDDGPGMRARRFRQAVARAHGAADRLLANSRHALDAADPVSMRWGDVQVGRRLADALLLGRPC